MGRESRQTRRAKERRLQQQRRHQPTTDISKWSLWVGAAIVVIIAAVLGTMAMKGSASGTSTPTPQAEVASQRVNGVGCSFNGEVTTYHEHAHLALYDKGHAVALPPYVGFNTPHDCLYWMHTHQPSLNIIHLEAPSKITPPLGTFFKIWGKPLNAHQIGTIAVQPGETVKTWIGKTPYYGSLSQIKLYRHESITIEVGPPFVKPVIFNFAKDQL